MNRIQNVRESKGLKQAELAQKAGISTVTLSRYENSKRSPQYDDLKNIAAVLETSVAYLMCEAETSAPSQECAVKHTIKQAPEPPAPDLTLRLLKLRIEIAQTYTTLREQDQEIIKSTLNAVIADIQEIEEKETAAPLDSIKTA